MTQNIPSTPKHFENQTFILSNKLLPFNTIFKILDYARAENKLNDYQFINSQFSHYTQMYIFHKAFAYVNAIQTKLEELRNSYGAEKDNKFREYLELVNKLKKLFKNPKNLAFYLTYDEDKTFNEKLFLLPDNIINNSNYSYLINVIRFLNNEQAILFIENQKIDLLKFFYSLNSAGKQILFDRTKSMFTKMNFENYDLKRIYEHLSKEQTIEICSAFLNKYKKNNMLVGINTIINLLSRLSVEKTSELIDIFKENIKALITSDFNYYDIARNVNTENKQKLFDLLNDDLKKKIKNSNTMYNF